MLSQILKLLTRKKTPVNLVDFNRLNPISSIFGLDRGTPIDRYYIEEFLIQNSHLIKGLVLEVGGTYYARKFGGEKMEVCESLYVVPDPGATLVGDLTDTLTLPQGKVDCFICVQTLNFIFDVQKAVEGIYYLLKPGGVVLATVSGISQISRYDMDRWGDYWRFTSASVEKLFSRHFENAVEINSYGNVMAATAFLTGVSLEDIPQRKMLDFHDPNYQLVITIMARKKQ
ncbi:MAG: class I SAM-dependent methyltransferase [Nitrospinae bacterium]|nr:class I SAM-dependent methyltransferase [Nitrospinota bacterium]